MSESRKDKSEEFYIEAVLIMLEVKKAIDTQDVSKVKTWLSECEKLGEIDRIPQLRFGNLGATDEHRNGRTLVEYAQHVANQETANLAAAEIANIFMTRFSEDGAKPVAEDRIRKPGR